MIHAIKNHFWFHFLTAEWSAGARMLCITFPAAPLKFRTSGLPQYGFKLELNCDLR
jgi:hypothetical protein